LLDLYELKFQDARTARPLNAVDLSSGEKVILQLALWLYTSQQYNRFPRLFLLDEPDSHLHPYLTRQFMDVMNEVLVEKYNARIILTTHSPSTVALAPEESIFEMWRDAPRIRRPKSRADTIGLLTAGLVIVSPSSRYVLVEDSEDVTFYNAVRDILSDYAPSRDPRPLRLSPSLIFLPASLGQGKNKVGGGKNVVAQWVEKFDAPPLHELFRGIIDLDSGNVSTPRVHVIGRYSIENYLLDPFVVFGFLLTQSLAPVIPGINISAGDKHLIRTLPENQLQAIVEAIAKSIQSSISNLTALEKTRRPVLFTNGKSVQYPMWMIERRGHELLPIYQSAFGGTRVITPPRLVQSLRRVRLITDELAEIMRNLQN
jgi:hypothetical protein